MATPRITTILTLCLSSSLLAQTASTKAMRRVLPVGSSLHDVSIPRYDGSYQKTSLLKAERIDTLPKQKLKGTNVDIEIYKGSETQATTHLNSAIYYEKEGIIHSLKNLQVFGQDFDIAGQGLILEWNQRSGFLLGKTQTLFYSENDKEMTSPTPKPVTPAAKKVTPKPRIKKLATSTALASTSIPALLTAAELKEIDELAQPSDARIQQVDAGSNKASQQMDAVATDMENQQKKLEQKVLPVVKQRTKPTETAVPLKPREDEVPVSVEADNGMYFDATTGTAIYHDNVVVIHPQMHLTCEDELKVLLKKSQPESSGASKKSDKFDGLDKAIATGNVIIRAKDSEGKPIITHSEIATYDGTTEIIVLRGGRPTVQQGNTIARILSDSGYIKILPNMSVRIVGRHEILADLNELQEN
jgi:lipopolysaccharide export system protein LptA